SCLGNQFFTFLKLALVLNERLMWFGVYNANIGAYVKNVSAF
ncbi:MAG: hypothetical protein JWQ57_3492, partial [Mucilaginibacter sp.]|nr:hypothetical protein [Mucilaginibacter sp.]